MSASQGAERVERAERAVPESETTRRVRLERGVEIILAVMLGAVALATAWSGYQSASWGGVQAVKFSQAGALRTESTRASTRSGQLVQIDVALFGNWVNAYAAGDEALTGFWEQRFRDEFRPAFEAWVATEPITNPNAPGSPFEMSEYRLSDVEEAQRLEQEAEATFKEGQAANQQGGDYVRNTVILATVLFLAGVASRFDWPPVRLAIVAIAVILLAVGLYNLATYPVA